MDRFESVDAFRKPDFFAEKTSPFDTRAVWFGKDGPEGDAATEVERDGRGFTVSEYADLLGCLDEPTDHDRAFPFRKITVRIDEDEILALAGDGTDDIDDVPADEIVRIAARIGADRIAERGGDEEQVESLPDVSDLEPVVEMQPGLRL